jgi:hypothetical protein
MRKRCAQKIVRIPQRHAHGERRPNPLLPFHALEAPIPPQELAAIGRDVADQHVGSVQLSEQPNDLILRGRAVAFSVVQAVP